MARERISTTVDSELVSRVRALDPAAPLTSLVEQAFTALLAEHRRAEIDALYHRAYETQPMDAPDEWGDLASFGEAVRIR